MDEYTTECVVMNGAMNEWMDGWIVRWMNTQLGVWVVNGAMNE